MIDCRYKQPAGPPPDSRIMSLDPKGGSLVFEVHVVVSHTFAAYLKDLLHSTAVCDRCMTCIQGAWFRCAYCGKDLCDACEELDNHNDTHLFMVFKAPVDMHAVK